MAMKLHSVISPEVSNNAERKIFNLFHDVLGTGNWDMFRSFGIINQNLEPNAEIDYCGRATKLEIFVLEIQAGRINMTTKNWSFTDKQLNIFISDKARMKYQTLLQRRYWR